MLVSIIGLPPTITYQELKALIKQQCNLTDFIVDNIVSIQGGTKKVRIGVSDDGDAMRIVKGLNGYILPGNFVLKVAIVGKTQSNQQGMAFESQNQYPTRNDFSTQRTDYRSSHDPIEAMSRPQPWGPNINQDQNIWTQETSIGQQMSHDSFSYHHQQQQQGYGQQTPFTSQRPDVAQYSQESQFGGKPNIPRHVETRSHVLRTIEIVDSPNLIRPPVQQGRYPPVHGYQQDKPVTMVKDNFQGPSFAQGNQQQGPGHYQGASHDKPQPWTHQNAGPYEKHYADDLKGPLDKRDLKTTQQMRNQNFKDYEKSTIPPQRKPSPGRSEPVGRTQHGRQTSPKNARRHVSPQKPGTLGKQSPVRAGMRGRSPVRSGPGRQSPTRPSMHTRMSPGRDSGQPITPDRPARLGRPTSQKQGYVESVVPNRHSPDRKTSGRPGSPNNYSDRGRGMDGRPNMTARPVSPGRQYGGRLVSPERLIPVRPGSPINRQPVGRQPALGKDVSPGRSLLGRPGLQAHSSGRPVSPTMRSTKRIGLPSMRPSGRPGSPDPNKYGTFRSRSNSPLPITDRPIQGRPGSPRRFVYVRPGSPGIRMATQQRSGQGKHGSPSGRRMSPSNRMASASGILGSPMRRNSPNHRHPGGREDSPNQVSPHPKDRYSSTHDLETLDKYGQNSKSKLVRPAYDCVAPNKAMYSGGFHHNVHENKYGRPGDQPWQKDDKYQKIEDDRRESRIPPRSIETEKRVHASERKSRSPIRRERSPFRDRLKRHSPSPRSPRRSWALEKRRSPEIREAPPPPIWPGQKRDDDQVHRRNIPDRSGNEENIKHTPVWNLQLDGKEVEHRREDRRLEKTERGLEEKDRNRRDIRNPHSERFAPQNEMQPNFSPQQINEKRDFLLNEEKRFSERQERRDLQRRSVDREDRHREEFSHYRNYSPQRLEEHSIRKNFDKELEDIYKRAVEFRRKTEEIRRSGERRREDYRDDERLNIKEGTTTDYQRSRQPNSPVNRNYQQNPSEEPRRISREKVEWKIESKPSLPEHVRAKREKAIKEIVKRLLERQRICDHLDREYEERVTEELKLEISKIVYRLFGNEDVSFIEIIIKYQAKYSIKDEEMLLHAVLNSLQKSNKNLKRPAPDTSEVHSKVARRSPVAAHQEEIPRLKLSDANSLDYAFNIDPPKLVTLSTTALPVSDSLSATQMAIHHHMINPVGASQFGGVPPIMLMGNNQIAVAQMNQSLIASQMTMHVSEPMILNQPSMVPAPYEPNVENQMELTESSDIFYLYICHNDFQPFNLRQVEILKRFLFSKIVEITESSRGWAPDITIKGLQNLFRYELLTKDPRSKDWLFNLDFSKLEEFSVVIYTKEELCYERAAIWLPGHSKNRKIEPLEKLKMQNNKLDSVSIGKWKLVKKIVNEKGTRLFVDMPPESTRALAKYDMMLSYELQKVNVFLRAVAVDKDAFDNCMKEMSITSKKFFNANLSDVPFPLINNSPSMVKITLSGCRNISVDKARKIKEVVIYHIFRYQQMGGLLRTDFLKYGYCKPNFLGIVPENQESKKWLLSRNFGKLKKNHIVVVGGEDDDNKLFTMTVVVNRDYSTNSLTILERLKSSNQGVKGIFFNKWKVDSGVYITDRFTVRIGIKMDVDSLETLKTLGYQLDYVADKNQTETVTFESELPYEKLEEELKQYKTEMMDSYDIANMELDSDDDKIICLD